MKTNIQFYLKRSLYLKRTLSLFNPAYGPNDDPPADPPADPPVNDDPPADDEDDENDPDPPTGDDETAKLKAQIAKMNKEARRIKGENKKFREAGEKERQRLQTALESKKLTEAEKEKLETQIGELDKQLLSEKQLAEKNALKLRQDHEQVLAKLTTDRDIWRKRHEDALIDQALTSAAATTGAESVDQIKMMFRSNAILEPAKDENEEPIPGQFVPKLTFTAYEADKEGQKVGVETTLPILEALSRIREDGMNANLFSTKAKPGTGEPGQPLKPGQRDLNKRPVIEDFRNEAEWREAHIAYADAQRKKKLGITV